MNPTTDVIVIGAGITGIGAAYYLRKNGLSYVVLEANEDLGGIWHTQRWHGARCDSDFVKYSFSFRPHVSPQCLQSREEIHRYLRAVADEFEIFDRIRFGTRVLNAEFDSEDQCWRVHTNRGTFTSRFLINGNGYFSEPYVPQFPGREQFAGEMIHTFQLDDRRTFEGKDVVLVGSGSTAICCAPELSRVSGSLTLLQRSPTYIYEIDNRATARTSYPRWTTCFATASGRGLFTSADAGDQLPRRVITQDSPRFSRVSTRLVERCCSLPTRGTATRFSTPRTWAVAAPGTISMRWISNSSVCDLRSPNAARTRALSTPG